MLRKQLPREYKIAGTVHRSLTLNLIALCITSFIFWSTEKISDIDRCLSLRRNVKFLNFDCLPPDARRQEDTARDV